MNKQMPYSKKTIYLFTVIIQFLKSHMFKSFINLFNIQKRCFLHIPNGVLFPEAILPSIYLFLPNNIFCLEITQTSLL